MTSICVECGGEAAVVDPHGTAPTATRSGSDSTRGRPTLAVVLKPDHVRDVDLFVQPLRRA